MLQLETYKDYGASYAILETIYRGLHAELMRDPALSGSLVLFLPYYVKYHEDGHSVMLIHPQERLGWAPSPIHALSTKQFFKDNAEIIEAAIAEGRSKNSILHRHVATINADAQAGARIDREHDGRMQYRILVEQSRAAQGAQAGSATGEYDVTKSFPHLYPALGVLCQIDGKVIGLVSMDFDDQLCEKIEAAFNSFMEPYCEMRLWQDLIGDTLVGYFKKATACGSWCDAGTPNGSHEAFADKAAKERACKEISGKLTGNDWAKLKNILSDAGENLTYVHNFLKTIQGADQINRIVPALWVALGNGKGTTVPVSAKHFSLVLNVIGPASNSAAQEVCLKAGELHSKWQWSECDFVPPWILLKGDSDNLPEDVESRLRSQLCDGHQGFTHALTALMGALVTAWPDQYDRRFESRKVPASFVNNEAAILETCFSKTPMAILLGPEKKMTVAIRGSWQLPAF